MRVLSSAIQPFFIKSRENKMTSVELLSYFYVVNIMSGDKSKILKFAKCASRDFTHFFILYVIKNQQSWKNYKCGKKWRKKPNSNIFWSFFFYIYCLLTARPFLLSSKRKQNTCTRWILQFVKVLNGYVIVIVVIVVDVVVVVIFTFFSLNFDPIFTQL